MSSDFVALQMMNRTARHFARGFSQIRIVAATLTRLPLADAISASEADSKHESKSDEIHDTSPSFRKHQTFNTADERQWFA